MGIPLIIQTIFPWFLCVCNMHNWSVKWLGLMCCGCAGWQPSGTHDTPLISCVYLPVWETVAVGQNIREVSPSAYMVCMYVSAVYMVLLWKAPSLGLSIYIFINHRSHREGGTEESFKCKRTLSACTQHTQAGSLPQPFYSIPPSCPTPCPQHTHPARLTVSQGDQTVDS